MKWLNPLNWLKSVVAAKIDAEIEKWISKDALRVIGKNAIAYAVELAESKVDVKKSEEIANDLIYCGNALIDIGTAVTEKSEDGREISESEMAAIMARVTVLFGDIITDEQLTAWREIAKNFIRSKLEI